MKGWPKYLQYVYKFTKGIPVLENLFWGYLWGLEERGGADFKNLRFSERSTLIEELLKNEEFESLIEFGAGYGQSFHPLSALEPKATYCGLDLDSGRVLDANAYFVELGLDNCLLIQHDLLEKTQFDDATFSIGITCGFLMYLKPEEIIRVLKEMLRITKGNLYFLEQHLDLTGSIISEFKEGGLKGFGYYLHDFKKIFQEISGVTLEFIEIERPRWNFENWIECGVLIKVSRNSTGIYRN